MSLIGEPGAVERLFRRRHRADPHDPRLRPRRPPLDDDAGERLRPGGVARLAAGDDHRHRAVIDARRIAGGGHAALLNSGRNLASAAISVCGRGCSSSATLTGPARPPGTSTAMISPSKNAVRLGGGVFALRGRGEGIGLLAGDLVVARQIVGGLRHRVGAEPALDLGVREARADRRIEDSGRRG